ncbi:MAG: hypothetical protein ACLQFF_14010 [Steroidobacteraceae bacterium]|jgi:hypothetical protein
MRTSTVSRARDGWGGGLLGIALLLGLSACVSTSLIDRWKDPGYNGPPLHKVLVVGVQKDQGRRRVWEGGMVAALTHEGVQATPSYAVFPDKAPTADQLASTASHEGFDAVMATHFVSASQRNYWMPGYAGVGFGWPWRYYGYWDAVYGPGYVETEYRADYQTDIFTVDAGGGKLIWTGITRSVDLSSTQRTTDEISRVLVPELTKQGILAANHK